MLPPSKIRYFVLLVLPVLALAAATPGAETNNPGNSPAPAPQHAAPMLRKGMTEAEIIAALGKPREITRMKAPSAAIDKVEKWVYRRQVGTLEKQVATGTRPVPTFRGLGGTDATGTRDEIVYAQKHVTIYNVIRLLMIDGKLEAARQTTEQEEHF